MKRIAFLLLNLCVILVVSAQPKEITILAVNDIHAAIENFPKFAGVVDSVRAVHNDVLLFSAGDNRTGNPLNDMYETPNLPIVQLMNKVHFNLSAVGNHEFDNKTDGLRYSINEAYFPYVCANMYPCDSLRIHVYPYKMFTVNDVKVCVLGLIQVNEAHIPDLHPANVVGIQFRNPETVVREYEWLRKQCDVMILLTHNGYEDDIELAKAFPEADVIIGGHSHTAVQGSRLHSGVLVTQAERWLKYVTEVRIRVEDGKVVGKEACLIDVKASTNSNASIQAMVDMFSNNEKMDRVLTRVNEFVNKEELGCFVADAIKEGTGADIAVQNAGGIRYDTHPEGNFTVNDVYRIDPFGNELVAFNLTGEEVVRMLAAASYTDDYGPAYVAGITYEITVGKNKRDVKNLVVKNLDGSTFDLKRTYKVVMNSYLASVCDYKKNDEGRNTFESCTDVMMRYIETIPFFDYKGVKRVKIR